MTRRRTPIEVALLIVWVLLGATTLRTTWHAGHPNSATFVFVVWSAVVVAYLLGTSRKFAGDVAPFEPANAAKALLERHGFIAHSELEGGWILFYRERDDATFQVRPAAGGAAEVEQVHLVDPWSVDVHTRWRVKPAGPSAAYIPSSLTDAMR